MRVRRQRVALRSKLRRKRNRGILVLTVLCAGGAALFSSRDWWIRRFDLLPWPNPGALLFPAREVELLGFSSLMRRELLSRIPQTGDSVLFFPATKFERQVRKHFPWVKEVRAYRRYLPSKLRLEALWRVPLARLRGERDMFLDAEGIAYVFPYTENLPTRLPELELEELRPEALSTASRFLTRLRTGGGLDFLNSRIVKVRIESPGSGVVFFLQGGDKNSPGVFKYLNITVKKVKT